MGLNGRFSYVKRMRIDGCNDVGGGGGGGVGVWGRGSLIPRPSAASFLFTYVTFEPLSAKLI